MAEVQIFQEQKICPPIPAPHTKKALQNNVLQGLSKAFQ